MEIAQAWKNRDKSSEIYLCLLIQLLSIEDTRKNCLPAKILPFELGPCKITLCKILPFETMAGSETITEQTVFCRTELLLRQNVERQPPKKVLNSRQTTWEADSINRIYIASIIPPTKSATRIQKQILTEAQRMMTRKKTGVMDLLTVSTKTEMRGTRSPEITNSALSSLVDHSI